MPLLVIGCGELRQREVQAECTSCHGSPDQEDGRPPPDLLGSTDTSNRGVGAHAAHLDSPNLEKPLECDDCHVVPETVLAPGHLDLLADEKDTPADVVQPGWNASGLRCQDTDCHARSGAAHPAPEWTRVDGAQIGCDGCHGHPPPDPHPDDTRCSLCHPGVNEAGDGFDDVTPHLNLKVDLTPDNDCASCHGNPPGPDLGGHTDTSLVGVGAHAAHVDSAFSQPVHDANCRSCHIEYATVLAEGHIDSVRPAEVIFGGLALSDGAAPTWDREADPPTCTNTYCHGAATPSWTDPTDAFRACGSCHGAPPAAPHPDDARCSLCHTEVNSTQDGFTDASRHVDGLVQQPSPVAGCIACHGSATSPAPPVDLDGNSSTSSRGVGAHEAHVQSGGACTACHLVPASALDAGHFDTPRPAEVHASLGWDGTQCNTAPCHTRSGANNPTPQWTDGTPLLCASCHGFPPPAPHTTWTDCFACHTSFPATHVNDAVDYAVLDGMACNTCHGTDPINPSPPPDLAGSSLTTDRGVGGHETHLSGGLGSAQVDCAECHAVPVLATDAGHLDTGPPADVVFPPGGLATADGSMPGFDDVALTCDGTYCHGATLGGQTLATVAWTDVGTGQAACGNCHGTPPPSHLAPIPYANPYDCENCHATAQGDPPPAAPMIVDTCLHINGVLDNSTAVGCP